MLLIDAGNTRAQWRFKSATHQEEGASDYAHFSLSLRQAPNRVVIAAVSAQERLRALLPSNLSQQALWLEHPLLDYPKFTHCYAKPERLGVDRWLAMIGARQYSGAPLIVVDAGTALTVDLLDANNQHLGGFIVPGMNMAQQALFAGTDKIRPYTDELVHHDITLGKDTLTCVQHGLEQQRLSFIQAIQQRYTQFQLFISGGDGNNLAKQLKANYYHNLVLDGMESLCAGYLFS